jgi:hypothetical protein
MDGQERNRTEFNVKPIVENRGELMRFISASQAPLYLHRVLDAQALRIYKIDGTLWNGVEVKRADSG